MKDVGPATEDEMVLAFVQAEIDADQWQESYAQALLEKGKQRTLVLRPSLASAEENAERITLLGRVRGYRQNAMLFTGFPNDVVWRRVLADSADLGAMQFANLFRVEGARELLQLAENTRAVATAAGNVHKIENETSRRVRGAIKAIGAGQPHPSLIAVTHHSGALILLEGHTRATAHAFLNTPEINILVGSSPGMNGWFFY